MTREHIPDRLCEHFIYRKWKSKLDILKEGPTTLPHFPNCGIHMQADRL